MAVVFLVGEVEGSLQCSLEEAYSTIAVPLHLSLIHTTSGGPYTTKGTVVHMR